MSFDFEYASKICLEQNNLGERCESVDTDTSAKVLGVGVALLM